MDNNPLHSDKLLIVDNFIKDPQLLEQINNDSYWDQRSQPSSWYKRFTRPGNPMEQYVHQVYHNMFPHIIEPSITGFEYWGWNVKAGDPGIDIHLDHDEYQQTTNGTIVTPRFLTIFYPEVSDDIEGGELYLYDEHHFADTSFFTDDSIPLNQRDRRLLGTPTVIKPKRNRLIIAPGSHYHEVAGVTKGFRRSLNCNPWGNPDDGRKRITFDYDDMAAQR